MQNPFTLTFGKSPLEPVERPVQTNEIVDAFTAESVNQQMFIITRSPEDYGRKKTG